MHVPDLAAEEAASLATGTRRNSAARLSQVVIRLVEIPAAILVLGEIVVLLAGIFSR